MKKLFIVIALFSAGNLFSQNTLTPELLWKLGRVTGVGLTKDKQYAIYTVSIPNVDENKSKKYGYLIPVNGGNPIMVNNLDSAVVNDKISPDGKYIITAEEVKLQKVYGKDLYPDLPKSNAHIYTSLNYRHWDEWEDGKYSHVFLAPYINGKPGEKKDLMPNELYDCPQKPFGGEEDYIWNPDGKHVVYVTKKKQELRMPSALIPICTSMILQVELRGI